MAVFAEEHMRNKWDVPLFIKVLGTINDYPLRKTKPGSLGRAY
jgi:hypothetical protein